MVYLILTSPSGFENKLQQTVAVACPVERIPRVRSALNFFLNFNFDLLMLVPSIFNLPRLPIIYNLY
jgi:hypothetical protein